MKTALSHVAFPVLSEDLASVARGLELLVDATNLGGGESPTREATWLRIGNLEVHLISTAGARTVEEGGTFSPHLAFAVTSIAGIDEIAERAGFATWRAGSLPNLKQLWVKLGESFVIELQECM